MCTCESVFVCVETEREKRGGVERDRADAKLQKFWARIKIWPVETQACTSTARVKRL